MRAQPPVERGTGARHGRVENGLVEHARIERWRLEEHHELIACAGRVVCEGIEARQRVGEPVEHRGAEHRVLFVPQQAAQNAR
jgi:hypothetical protein